MQDQLFESIEEDLNELMVVLSEEEYVAFVENDKYTVNNDLITIKEQNGTIYRNVDMNNMFPSNNGVPKTGSNWSTGIGQSAANDIKESAENFGDGSYYIQFSITLSPDQIKALKNYNKKHKYSDEVIYNCTKNDGYYTKCSSYFLDILRGKSMEYSQGTFGTLDINLISGESKKDRLN